MRITDCLIDTGDDNIAIKSGKVIPEHPGAGAEDIVITGCTFRHGHGVSIGSETNGGVKNVRVHNCKFENTTNAIRIKSYRGRGGEVSDIPYSDLTMEGVNPAIVITAYYPKIPATDEAQPVTDAVVSRHRD